MKKKKLIKITTTQLDMLDFLGIEKLRGERNGKRKSIGDIVFCSINMCNNISN